VRRISDVFTEGMQERIAQKIHFFYPSFKIA
jgi:hypothetical protein